MGFMGGLIEQGEGLAALSLGRHHAGGVLPGGVVVVVAVGAVGGARAGAALDLAAACQQGDVSAKEEHKQFFHVLFQYRLNFAAGEPDSRVHPLACLGARRAGTDADMRFMQPYNAAGSIFFIIILWITAVSLSHALRARTGRTLREIVKEFVSGLQAVHADVGSRCATRRRTSMSIRWSSKR